MSKYGNENAAAGGRGRSTADRDRMYGGAGGFGGGMGGGRGTMGQQQDRRNMANAVSRGNIAPGVAAGFGGAMGGASARRTINTTPSYEMSLRNMYELSKMLPGPGMAIRAGLGIAGTGLGPNFTGPRGTVNGPGDYDPTNRFGTLNSQMFQPRPIQAAGAPRPAQPAPQLAMSQMQMPAGQFSIPGPSQYGVNLPSYGYFGKPPALQRPKSLIMGGI